MCLITELIPGFNLDDAIELLLDSEATMNKDGISVSDVAEGAVHFANSVNEIMHLLYSEKHYLIHQRYATRGGKLKTLRHPFKIDNELWLAHNGTLGEAYLKSFGINKLKLDESDTSALANALYRTAPLSGHSPKQLMTRLQRNLGGNVITLIGYGQVIHSEQLIEINPFISVSNLYSLTNYGFDDSGYANSADCGDDWFFDEEINLVVDKACYQNEQDFWDAYEEWLNRDLMELSYLPF
jgi:hypothetical protein